MSNDPPPVEKKSPFRHPWWSSFSGIARTYPTIQEQIITQLSDTTRRKPDWDRKYKIPDIRDNWRKEILTEGHDVKYINEICDYMLEELKWYEWLQHNWLLDSYKIGYDDKMVMGDDVVEDSVRQKLVNQANELYELFGENVDYHPNSNNQVIDLVHPSLFPLQYDLTLGKNLKSPIKFSKEEITWKEQVAWGTSERFQWLPSLFEYDSKSEKFLIKSYINNLHPKKFKSLYDTIETVFNSCLVGLDYVLSRASSSDYYRGEQPDPYNAYSEEFTKRMRELEETENWDVVDEYYETREQYLKDYTPKWNGPPEIKRVNLANDFPNLKVIVKMANIELTPENPVYNGGSWHVEGTINEDIVATILYYYEMENILESTLAFRAAYEEPNYEQNDNIFLEVIYGLRDEDRLTRNMGSFEAKEGRVVIFPNMFQHKVQPFELMDKTKKGYRKILCFFVVDPYNKAVRSTADVIPQQNEWYQDSSLQDLFPKVLGENFKPQSLEEAKTVREQLMSERSASADDDDDDLAFTRLFSLCEH